VPEQITIFTSRKAYEFRMEGLRLTLLTLPDIQELIRQTFAFQAHAIGTPQPTFGEVASTFPPGLVFNLGVYVRPTGDPVPIRLLHIEPLRIVVDVAGLSSDAEDVYRKLRESLNGIVAPDGGPAIDEPYEVRDYSEVVLRLKAPSAALVSDALLTVTRQAWAQARRSDHSILVPTISFVVQDSGIPFQGVSVGPGARTIQLAPRQGYLLDDQMYFSSAPLDSDRHLEYLNALEQSFAESSLP